MWKIFLTVCILWTMPWHWTAAGDASPGASARMALVIGNGDYRSAPLANPVRDAQAMAEALAERGFEVTRYDNLEHSQMRTAIARFKRRLAAAGGVGLFYFAGHGVQLAGRTLLMPVDADSASPDRLPGQSIDLGSVLEAMSAPRPGQVNLVILDTCRENASGPGPAPALPLPGQTLVAYATAPGSAAADGRRHGIFTAELLQAMRAPGTDIDALFRQVEAGVSRATGARQTPRVISSIAGRFRFAPPARPAKPIVPTSEVAVTLASRGLAATGSAAQNELVFWNSIKGSRRPEDYASYLKAYPQGHFAALARGRIERLTEAPPKTEPLPAQPAAAKPAVKPPRKKRQPVPDHVKARAIPRPAPEIPPLARLAPPEPAVASSDDFEETEDCPDCPTMVELPGGLFTMGSDQGEAVQKPSHSVALGEAFAIAKEAVTVAQWNACADAGACPPLGDDADDPEDEPVRNVSWEDAQQYVQWLSRTTGKPYRLPTEAEWEYARALHATESGTREWVSDCWHDSYMGAPPDGSNWDEPGCTMRVVRGGSPAPGKGSPVLPSRARSEAGLRNPLNGFRVVRDSG